MENIFPRPRTVLILIAITMSTLWIIQILFSSFDITTENIDSQHTTMVIASNPLMTCETENQKIDKLERLAKEYSITIANLEQQLHKEVERAAFLYDLNSRFFSLYDKIKNRNNEATTSPTKS